MSGTGARVGVFVSGLALPSGSVVRGSADGPGRMQASTQKLARSSAATIESSTPRKPSRARAPAGTISMRGPAPSTITSRSRPASTRAAWGTTMRPWVSGPIGWVLDRKPRTWTLVELVVRDLLVEGVDRGPVGGLVVDDDPALEHDEVAATGEGLAHLGRDGEPALVVDGVLTATTEQGGAMRLVEGIVPHSAPPLSPRSPPRSQATSIKGNRSRDQGRNGLNGLVQVSSTHSRSNQGATRPPSPGGPMSAEGGDEGVEHRRLVDLADARPERRQHLERAAGHAGHGGAARGPSAGARRTGSGHRHGCGAG